METPTKLPSDAPTETPPDEQLPDEPPPAPTRVLGFELGDLLSFGILIGLSAWLWSHASATLGSGAPILGAAIGLVIALLVRAFC
jgi:hypothetical protein